MKKNLFFTVIAVFVFSFVRMALAEDITPAENPSAVNKDAGISENTEYAYGTVSAIDISANTIVIKEQNYDNDSEADVAYYFSPDTAFENIKSLNEISVGNDVDISFLLKADGKKVIKFISVYKPELEGEEE